MRLPLLAAAAAAAAAGFAYYVYRKPASSAQVVEDDVLITRVRKALDGLVEQPGSVNIAVQDGCVTLSGPAAERELRPVVKALRRLAGVRRVECRLTAHAA
jgi:osmotically-inducible protein OsmY